MYRLESAMTDASFRRRAVSFYNDLVKYLKKPSKLKFVSRNISTKNEALFVPAGDIDIMLPVLLESHNLKCVDTRIDRSIFVHEFIHYLDSRRMGKSSDSVSRIDKGSLGDYFSDPGEFDAYYQEGVAEIEFMLKNALKSKHGDRVIKKFFGSLDNFTVFAKTVMGRFFDQDWMRSMNRRTREKFLKRLYGFWNEVVVVEKEIV